MDEILTEQPGQEQAELGLTEQAAAPQEADSGSAGDQVSTFDIGGEKVTLDQIKQWKEGHLMQSDYTRKTQELARQSEALKPYQEMAQYLQTNPDKAQAIYNLLNGNEPGEVDPIQQKIQHQERMLQGLIQDNARSKADQRISAIKNDPKYDGMFSEPEMEELLLAKALQTQDFELTKTAESIHKLMSKLKASTKLDTEQQIKSNLASPTRKGSLPGQTMAPPASFDPSKADDRDIAKKALEMLS